MDSTALDAAALARQITERNFTCLTSASLEADMAREVGQLLYSSPKVYESLLLGTVTHAERYYDWNVGFLLPHLNLEEVTPILHNNKPALFKSEGIAWGLGEAGNDAEGIVEFLYEVAEACIDFDAWWCAADALGKLGVCDSVDLKKRTLTKPEWMDLDYCLEHLAERAAIIGVLKRATEANTDSIIVPACRAALRSEDRRIVRNAVWLLERLRVDDKETVDELLKLYLAQEDHSTTLAPRIVEAFGQIAAPSTRPLLESALTSARYYRTRAYAADGLAKIGDPRSLDVLDDALSTETDEKVLSHISDAIYSLKYANRSRVAKVSRSVRWPENGMIADETNKWYGNPEIYDRFSWAEDPLALSLDLGLEYIPLGAERIADLGTGTGRMALRASDTRGDIQEILALDGSQQMVEFLTKRLEMTRGTAQWRIKPMLGDLSTLPFEDSSLDAVVSSWAFPSRMWNVDACLQQVREVRRVLKPNGMLVTVGWDEQFRDQLSELWYRFVPEPEHRRETFEDWRRRRKLKITSPRNCHLTFVRKGIKVPLMWETAEEAAEVLGYLFGYSAGEWVIQQRQCEFSIFVGITADNVEQLDRAISLLETDARSL